VDDEDRFAAALFTTINLGKGVGLSFLVEYVHQDIAGGTSDERDFLTLAGQEEWNGFKLAVAWTGCDTSNAAEDDDFQVRLSAG
jgi:hypothetical protein